MRLNRAQSTVIGVGIIVLFFVFGIAYLRQARPRYTQDTPAIIPTPIPALTPGSAETPGSSNFVLNEFHRSETRDGKKIWEAEGKQGQFFPETNSAEIEELKLWLFRESGDIVELTAGRAVLHLNGASLARAEVFSGVKIVYDKNITIETDKADFDQVQNLVLAPGYVKIQSEVVDTTGYELRADVERKEFFLARDVESVVKPKVG